MTNEPLATILWHDARALAQIMEGVSGSLKQGIPLDAEDLDAVTQSAQWIWDGGPQPDPARNQIFQSALRDFTYAGQACLRGAPEALLLQDSSHRLARLLRQLAAESQTLLARKELPLAVGERLDRLARTYNRFAPTPLETIER